LYDACLLALCNMYALDLYTSRVSVLGTSFENILHADCHQKSIKIGWQDQEDQLSCLSSDRGLIVSSSSQNMYNFNVHFRSDKTSSTQLES